jgi:hypothetical protein
VCCNREAVTENYIYPQFIEITNSLSTRRNFIPVKSTQSAQNNVCHYLVTGAGISQYDNGYVLDDWGIMVPFSGEETFLLFSKASTLIQRLAQPVVTEDRTVGA